MPQRRNQNRQGRGRNRPAHDKAGRNNRTIDTCPRGLAAERMKTISAPYNFVPVSDWVHIPEWSKRASHDWPFQDGYSGEIHYKLIAESPLLVGNQQTKAQGNQPGEVRPFKLPGGPYAVPGSSIKGMLRAVVEIAGFGRLRMVDDQKLSVRDLTSGANKIYGSHMTQSHYRQGKQVFEPKVKAGWLRFDAAGNTWRITPCQFSRVEHDDLAAYNGKDWWKTVPRKTLMEKYSQWEDSGKDFEVSFTPGQVSDHRHGNRYLRYSKAQSLGTGSHYGTLVFTGQPAERVRNKRGRKHMEFIFYDDNETRSFDVPESVWRDFSQIHGDSDEWLYWRSEAWIPVFYLIEEEGRLHSLGLAMMYRLAYDNSLHDAIRNSSPRHLEEPGEEAGYDMADLLFGAINSRDQNDALRGRVSCELARSIDADKIPQAQPRTILSSPKPSYYPNYIQQTVHNIVELSGQHYKTLMDNDVKLRGFKRYPARGREKTGVQALADNQSPSVQVRLHTLPQGVRFAGRVVFHNLKPEELGALLWAMTWGGNKSLRHGLGMGKPFGFGQVRFELDHEQSLLIPNRGPESSKLSQEKMEELIESFTGHMEKAAGDQGGCWQKSPQIVNLMTMADPETAEHLPTGMELRHMCLNSERKINEFVWARQQTKKRINGEMVVLRPKVFVLADYAGATGKSVGSAPTGNTVSPPDDAGEESGEGNESAGAASRWLRETFDALKKEHNIPDQQMEQVWRGKPLASAWQAIDDPELKQEVLAQIRQYWKEQGWWDAPPRGAARKARPLYGD